MLERCNYYSLHGSGITESHYNFSIMAAPLRDAWQQWAVRPWLRGRVAAARTIPVGYSSRKGSVPMPAKSPPTSRARSFSGVLLLPSG
jgi:hypothetical protein